MTDNPKPTFARRVRAAKPRATKYEIRDDVISGLGWRSSPRASERSSSPAWCAGDGAMPGSAAPMK